MWLCNSESSGNFHLIQSTSISHHSDARPLHDLTIHVFCDRPSFFTWLQPCWKAFLPLAHKRHTPVPGSSHQPFYLPRKLFPQTHPHSLSFASFISFFKFLFQLLISAITNQHKSSGLEQRVSSYGSGGQTSQNQGISRTAFLGRPFIHLFQILEASAFLGSQPLQSPLVAPSTPCFSALCFHRRIGCSDSDPPPTPL